MLAFLPLGEQGIVQDKLQYPSESKWTICKNRKYLIARSTVFKKTIIFLRNFYSRNLVIHLLQVLVLNHKQALSLNQIDGRDLHLASLSASPRRTVNEENPTL